MKSPLTGCQRTPRDSALAFVIELNTIIQKHTVSRAMCFIPIMLQNHFASSLCLRPRFLKSVMCANHYDYQKYYVPKTLYFEDLLSHNHYVSKPLCFKTIKFQNHCGPKPYVSTPPSIKLLCFETITVQPLLCNLQNHMFQNHQV